MKNVGMLGGTFDPPHLAHLIAGERAVEAFALDTLLFIPTNTPPHKHGNAISSAEDRFAMTTLAIQGNRTFEASHIELDRPGPSYTIDTLRELQEQFSPDKIFLFIGLDQLAVFNSWHRNEDIFAAAEVVAMMRPGYPLETIDASLLSRVSMLSIPLLDISSNVIRARVRAGK